MGVNIYTILNVNSSSEHIDFIPRHEYKKFRLLNRYKIRTRHNFTLSRQYSFVLKLELCVVFIHLFHSKLEPLVEKYRTCTNKRTINAGMNFSRCTYFEVIPT
jgi:hypothetical protein